MTAYISHLAHRGARFSPRRLLGALAAYESRRRQRIDLAHVDDRLLRDIGVTRAELERELGRPLT
jgi:uncharacterized protein YjiS (DUF1127 family)